MHELQINRNKFEWRVRVLVAFPRFRSTFLKWHNLLSGAFLLRHFRCHSLSLRSQKNLTTENKIILCKLWEIMSASSWAECNAPNECIVMPQRSTKFAHVRLQLTKGGAGSGRHFLLLLFTFHPTCPYYFPALHVFANSHDVS